MIKLLKNPCLLISFLVISKAFSQENNQVYKFKHIISKFEHKPIAAKKHLLSFSASHNLYPLILETPSILMDGDLITRTTHRVGLIDALYINYQYTVNPSMYLETGFKYIKHYHGYNGNIYHFINGGIINDLFSIYSTLSFDFGCGYRIITNNNFRLFDLHAGISLGMVDNKVGSGGTFSPPPSIYTDRNGNTGVLNFSSSYIITNRTNLGSYIGVSKDIRITENLYITARFHNHFGKNRSFSQHTINYSLSTIGVENEAYGRITSKGRMYALGLKWLF